MKRNSLNQAYRLVWNHTRNCWMAVAETCRSRGKSGRSGGVVAAAVVAALGALGSTAATAAPLDSCSSGSSAFVSDSADVCVLSGSESVSVTGGVSLAVPGSSAISVSGTSNTIVNSGTVSSGTASAIHNLGTINSLVNSGKVSAPSGSSNGVDNATFSSLITSLSNSGTISGNTSGVRNAGTVNALTNASTGSVLGNTSGISSSGTVGTVSNLGNITGGAQAGIVGSGGSFAAIVNSGTVQGLGSDALGIALSNTRVTGSISNTGTIAGQADGVGLINGSSVNGLTNTNLITGATYAGVFVDNSQINTISNSSRAVTTTTSGTVYTTQVAATVSGAESGIEIDGGYVGSIANTGVILGGGTMAGILNEGGSVNTIANSAQTFSNTAGTVVSVATLVGSITGGDYGITNRTNGTDTGYIDTVSNTGVIHGRLTGILNEGGDIGTITNGVQVFTQVSGTVTTTSTVVGSITGGEYGISNVSASGDGPLPGSIDLISNAGYISGNTGVNAEYGTLGSVVNTGTIEGTGSKSIGIDLYQTHVQSVTNAGLITGEYKGIDFNGAETQSTESVSTTLWGATQLGTFYGYNYSDQAECTESGLGSCVSTVSTSLTTVSTPSPLATLVNQEGGTITAANIGIAINSGTVTTLRNDGLIARLPDTEVVVATSSIATLKESFRSSIGIYNDGTIGALSNSGTIGVAGTTVTGDILTVTVAEAEAPVVVEEQRFDVGIGNEGTIQALSNTGTVLALNEGISNSGNIGTLVNGEDGTVSGEQVGVFNGEDGTISSLINSGLLEGVTVSGVLNQSTITSLNNLAGGIIKGGEVGIDNDGGFIGSLNNTATGRIAGVENGVFNSGTIFGLNNYGGQIEGTGSFANGVYNTVAGTIQYLRNGEDGVIQGTGAGIANDGTIGSLTNDEDGTISGQQTGVANAGTIGTLSNYSLIEGTTVSGIRNVGTISSLLNFEDGVISSANEGISNTGTIGTLSNNGGTITGGTDGIFNASTGTITSLNNSGQIDGGGTATGIYNAGTIVGLVNSGKIDGGTASGVFNGRTISSLNNTIGGTITAGTYGVFNLGTIGNVNNAGLIDATNADDLAIYNVGTISSGLSNSGTIAGTLFNSNRILSSSGEAVSNSGTVLAINNTIDGTISGDDNGIYNTGTINALSNTGLITGEFDSAIYNDGTITSLTNAIATRTIGTVVSTFVGTISGEDGVENDYFIGSLSNSGLIEGTIGSGIYNDGTITNLTNNAGGTIRGEDGIVNDEFISRLSNSGLIEGATYSGLYNDGGIGTLTNAAGGTITGADNGIWIDDFSTVTSLINSGLIEGQSDAGIRNDAFATITGLTNAAGATIKGDYGIDNNGTITSLSNSGLIDATFTGIYNAGSINSLNNTVGGTISGGEFGISNNSDKFTGTIGSLNNSGVIEGGEDGISNAGTIGSIVNSGTISGEDHAIYNTGTITDGITNTGTLDGDVYVGSATLNLRGTTARVYGDVRGSGQVLIGDGTATAYFQTNGNISVSGGVTVNPTATLELQDGAVVGYALLNAGKVFVDDGNSATVSGNYTHSGVLSIGASSASSYGQVVVDGAATLTSDGSFDVDVKSLNSLVSGEVLENVLTASTLTGVTATGMLVTDNSYLLNFEAVQDGTTAVDLNVVRGSIQQAAADAGFGPGSGAGGALDALQNGCMGEDSTMCGYSSGLADFLEYLDDQPTAGAVANALGQALPLMQSNMQQSILGAQQQVTNVIDGRQTGGQASGDGWLTQRQMWFKPLAARIDQDNDGGVAGYKAKSSGFVLGAEGSLDATNRLGLALAYTNTRVKGRTSTVSHDAKFDGYQLIAYGTSAMPTFGQGVDLNWQADVGFGSTKGSRSAFNGVAYADYKSHSIHVGAGLSRNIDMGEGVSITPSVRADYTTLRDKAYTETGSGALTLHVNKRTTDQFIVSAGGKFNKQLDTQWLLSGNASLGVDLINEASTLAARFTGGGPLFSTNGIKQKAWMGTLGLSLQYKPSETVSWEFSYDMSKRSSYTDQTISAKIKWAF